jgi:hypothetical protein
VETKFIIVAYGDIRGYKLRMKKKFPQGMREEFLGKFYDELGWFVLSSDFKVKYMGDGVMIIRELKKKGNRIYDALRFLFGVHKLTNAINAMIKTSLYPPDGFRMRIACGTADKTKVPDSNNKNKFINEYNSVSINLAEAMLHVNSNENFICHGSVVDLIGHQFNNVVFKLLDNVKCVPGKIDKKDADNMWTFSFKKGFHIA